MVAASLRAELAGARLKALQERAAAEDVPEDDIDEASEAERPKVALIELIVQHASSRATGGSLLTELRQLRPSQLKKRARDVGVSVEALDAADDAEVPKEALMALIVEAADGA